MADMVQISEDVLASVADILNQKYVRYLANASKANNQDQKMKYMLKARKVGVLLEGIYAVLDPEGDD